MKRMIAAAAALLLLTSLTAGCRSICDLPDAPSPSPTEVSADNTAVPTQEPTTAPTEAPTQAPAPTFAPYSAATGRLTEGPFLPEGAEYVVIKGESDLYYVYDDMGELMYSFNYEDNDGDYSVMGIYGPKGVTCRRLIATGEEIGELEFLGDIIFQTEYYQTDGGEDDSWEHCITKVYNSELELMCEFERGEAAIGYLGGILHVDGKLIVLDREFDWKKDSIIYECAPKIFSESGEYLGTLDPEPFGAIYGVLGNKYVIGCDDGIIGISEYFGDAAFDIYTLDGRRVMENVGIDGWDSGYFPDEEMTLGMLLGVKYVTAEDGTVYDSELAPAANMPEDTSLYGTLARPYHALELEEAQYVSGNVYAGVKDGGGNWLFRIYNPGNASDSDNSEGDRFWQVYGTWSRLQYIWRD